jgi:hypothetical protein
MEVQYDDIYICVCVCVCVSQMRIYELVENNQDC